MTKIDSKETKTKIDLHTKFKKFKQNFEGD